MPHDGPPAWAGANSRPTAEEDGAIDPRDQLCHLLNLAGLSGAAIRRLLAFETIEESMQRDPAGTARRAGLRARQAERLARLVSEKAAAREVSQAARSGVGLITYHSPGYPECLRSIPDPPLVLYSLGRLDWRHLATRPRVAVVGARRCSVYGRNQAYRVGEILGSCGVIVVSGLARGVDQATHRGVLAAGGYPVAVLGCGVDRVYPPEAGRLHRAVREQGALISEFPLATPPHRRNFPRRNRLLAGLAHIVIIIEATRRSGSLITAHHALDQGREVWALPGPVDSPTSEGTNALIRDGAPPLLDPREIVTALGLAPGEFGQPSIPRPESIAGLDAAASRLLACLQSHELGCDALCEHLEMEPEEIMELLIDLAGRGLVEERPGARWARSEGGASRGKATRVRERARSPGS